MNRKEFAKRRQQLINIMGENSIAILPNTKVKIRNNDINYIFRSDSNFYYLSGFDEPESALVIIPGRPNGEYIIFCRKPDPHKELWNGHYTGQKAAMEQYGADDSYPYSELNNIVPTLLRNKTKIFYMIGNAPTFDQYMARWLDNLRDKSHRCMDSSIKIIKLSQVLNELRIYKSSAEIKAMRTAATISVQAHIRAMKSIQIGKWEYQVEADIMHEFMRNNCQSPAYPSIVGSGKNGCILHYIKNNSRIKDKDLILIDAGAEFDYYAADITRTFPVNGKFTTTQKALYSLILDAQKAAISKVRPGNHCNQPHEAAVLILTQGLIHLGLLKGKIKTLIRNKRYCDFYMHRTSHWLGMDVHDVGDYKIDGKWRLLKKGMVLTIEPGLYIRAPNSISKKWHFIGIRIEDDVLVTKTGHEVLTQDAPREIKEIEDLMAKTKY
ncbi:MAG: aminopeptidase P N-terminal domain-containing protein [Piscirickettsiaceae bacterium]|nr:aminopeptidase P N-terminal domain-containing protein [Piscirickettsiaceae bacterium]